MHALEQEGRTKGAMETRRGQIITIVVLAVLLSVSIGLLAYGMLADNGAIAIFGFCMTLAMFFGLMVNVMLLGWSSGKR